MLPMLGTQPTLVSTIRHPQFYFEDGTVVLEVSDNERRILYRLHKGILASRSTVLKDTLSLPRDEYTISSDVALEGSNDEHPFNLSVFTLNRVTPRKFEHLCIYLFCGPSALPNTEEFLIDILDLSTFLDIEDGVTYVINEFDSGKVIHPALRMELARTYRIHNWIATAFRELVVMPLLDLNLYHAHQIGIEAYHCLVRTKANIQQFQKAIAAVSPPVTHGPDCRTHLDCQIGWEKEWWNGLARNILHPDFTPDAHDTIAELQNVQGVPGMCNACFRRTIDAVFERDIFGKERAYIEDGITGLMDMISNH
ncbi:hypothetical protein BJ912DRAFT_637486 [Pholiota molesta]|nr:hypothetical protein BJ912DRAFT_637486 [Pholiota molesta]